MYNWFTSSPLLTVLEEKKITGVGTVRHNRRDIPAIAKSAAGRDHKSVVYYRSGSQLLASFIDRKKTKPVLLLSTLHRDCVQGVNKP